jgi:diguanylate cyclase
MSHRVTTSKHVWLYTVLITLLSVAVPLVLVSTILWYLPWPVKAPYLFLATGIPLLIAAPISYVALGMMKTINLTVDAVNNLVKYDALTSVLCRSYFYQMWREGRRKGGFLAIVDADKFKSINDKFGHDVGDEALKHIAHGLSRVVPDFGFVGRLGGEEFCIYLPHATRDQAKLVVSEVCSWFRNVPLQVKDHELQITVSIGLTIDNPNEAIGIVMKRADQCLYAAKNSGRDRYVQEIDLDGASKAA